MAYLPFPVILGAMANLLNKLPFEVWFTVALLGLMLLVGQANGLPVSLPSGGGAAFVGVHYLYPLIGLAAWAFIVGRSRRQSAGATFFIALPCYALVLLAHFNFKLWVPDLNPALFDAQYWAIDQALRPLVEGCMALRSSLGWAIPLDSNFYMYGFIALFYLSFTVHALGPKGKFRALVIAALLFQGLGALSYLIAPALGPFLYERGVEAIADHTQQSLLATYQQHVAGGSAWVAVDGSKALLMGLAAMPSLHAGGSFLFLLFALRHDRRLVWIMLPLWAFISVDAIANRWHYLVDLPAGMVLAWLSVRAGEAIAKVSALPLALPWRLRAQPRPALAPH